MTWKKLVKKQNVNKTRKKKKRIERKKERKKDIEIRKVKKQISQQREKTLPWQRSLEISLTLGID